MNAGALDDSELAEIFKLDLWNEHRFQILAARRFCEVLAENVERGVLEGDEPALASALIHTRSLLEFYRPKQDGRHSDTVFWRTGTGPITNHRWQGLSGSQWSRVEKWVQPMHVYLGHISRERRTLSLPEGPDENGQRWPLMRFAECSSALLTSYLQLIKEEGQRGPEILEAIEEVEQRTTTLWSETEPTVATFRW